MTKYPLCLVPTNTSTCSSSERSKYTWFEGEIWGDGIGRNGKPELKGQMVIAAMAVIPLDIRVWSSKVARGPVPSIPQITSRRISSSSGSPQNNISKYSLISMAIRSQIGQMFSCVIRKNSQCACSLISTLLNFALIIYADISYIRLKLRTLFEVFWLYLESADLLLILRRII